MFWDLYVINVDLVITKHRNTPKFKSYSQYNDTFYKYLMYNLRYKNIVSD